MRLLARPIAFHRPLAVVAGSAAGGVFLSQLVYWSDRASHPAGWIYKSASEWHEETLLSVDEQRGVRRRLVGLGVLEEDSAHQHFQNISKFDKTRCFRLNFDCLLECLCSEYGQENPVVAEGGKFPDRTAENPEPRGGKRPAELRKKPVHWTKTTSDTTTCAPVVVGGAAKFCSEIRLAASAAGLTTCDAQRLADALAGALALPHGDKGRPGNVPRWLAATAAALTNGDFVEGAAFHSGKASRQSLCAGSPSIDDIEHQLRLAASAAAVQRQIGTGGVQAKQ